MLCKFAGVPQERREAASLIEHRGDVQAGALNAELVRVGLSAAVSVVPVTATVIIAVVTHAVSSKAGDCALFGSRALRRWVVWVSALAVVAVAVVISGSTAITSIPVAPAVVVLVVADAVSGMTVDVACRSRAWTVARRVLRVQAQTICTLSERVLAASEFVETPAAVAVIPVTGTNVVCVVAKIIAHVKFGSTGAITWPIVIRVGGIVGSRFGVRVQANAIRAIACVHAAAAAISTIPGTPAIIVAIVANVVRHPPEYFTSLCSRTILGVQWTRRIQATAFLTIRKIIFDSSVAVDGATAISSIPIARAIVVKVVTYSICVPVFYLASTTALQRLAAASIALAAERLFQHFTA